MPREISDAKVFMDLFQDQFKKIPAGAEKKTATTGDAKADAGKKDAGKKDGAKKDGAKEAAATKKPTTTFKKRLTIKVNKRTTKFKLRTSKMLYTFKTDNGDVAKKIISGVPTNIETQEIKKSRKKITKKK